ncbi:MAG TPA: hypothetical protein VGG74_03870 [Kofleriaceae bacterium]
MLRRFGFALELDVLLVLLARERTGLAGVLPRLDVDARTVDVDLGPAIEGHQLVGDRHDQSARGLAELELHHTSARRTRAAGLGLRGGRRRRRRVRRCGRTALIGLDLERVVVVDGEPVRSRRRGDSTFALLQHVHELVTDERLALPTVGVVFARREVQLVALRECLRADLAGLRRPCEDPNVAEVGAERGLHFREQRRGQHIFRATRDRGVRVVPPGQGGFGSVLRSFARDISSVLSHR